MEDLIDFTNCKVDNTYLYRGQNGKKIGINYNNHIYMLKFPPFKEDVENYSNSCISEYVACHIFASMGFKVQETLLGKFTLENNKTKIVCACKDFTENDYILKEFAELKNSIINSPANGYGTDLIEVLDTINEQNLYPNDKLKDFFWDMFIADSLLGNFDRHNGNWGFLINRDTKEIEIAPIFDCGSCLYPQLEDSQMKEYINKSGEINKRIYIFPNSALKLNNKKINYYEFINSGKVDDCNKALLRVYPKIDFRKINDIIDNTPSISDIRKDFYKTILHERYEKILTPEYQKLQKALNNINDEESEEDEI